MVFSRRIVNNYPTVFFTGATGFLGGATLFHLLDSACDGRIVCLVRAADRETAEERVLRSLARFAPRPWLRLPRNVEILNGDIVASDWHHAPELDGVTHVLHLAANTSFGNTRGIRKTNVEGALSVAKAMQGRRIERYLHAGTATICGATPPHVVHEDDYPDEKAEHLVAYTRSKAEAERLLAERFADLPIVVARPSIVVGHTSLGCKPSGSIFWVLRAVEALRFIIWDPRNRMDVVPVDYAAAAFARMLFAPQLRHARYHVSAGEGSAVRWTELAAEYAHLCGGPATNRYEVGDLSRLTPQRMMRASQNGHTRHLMHALKLYYRFCSLDLVFDNHRLLEEGVPAPPRFTDYMRVCLDSSNASIYDQMRIDLEPSLTLV
jgi:nucleoside-diphosphate-sugar epimerase